MPRARANIFTPGYVPIRPPAPCLLPGASPQLQPDLCVPRTFLAEEFLARHAPELGDEATAADAAGTSTSTSTCTSTSGGVGWFVKHARGVKGARAGLLGGMLLASWPALSRASNAAHGGRGMALGFRLMHEARLGSRTCLGSIGMHTGEWLPNARLTRIEPYCCVFASLGVAELILLVSCHPPRVFLVSWLSQATRWSATRRQRRRARGWRVCRRM